MSIGVSSSSSYCIGAIGRDEDVMALSTMVRSLHASIEIKIVVQNNNLGFAFERRMMLLFVNLG
jgi:hypothetical protein